jgi:enoyl-CoA hydratase/carnithine racemase
LSGASQAVAEALTFTLTKATPSTPFEVAVADLQAAAADISQAVAAAPQAAGVLDEILRLTAPMTVASGLVVESLAYSMLLASPEFAAWRANRPVRPIPDPTGNAVLLERDQSTLTATLNRPDRHNAFGVAIRDGLVDALDLTLLDTSVRQFILRGSGPSFCSGGDLDEFGSATNFAYAHRIRIQQSVAGRLHALRDRAEVRLHGACIGAGIELPAFAGRVVASGSTAISLPELSMGLIPGAGGTVSIPRRIGRWRTAWLVISGAQIDATTALEWGLIDEVFDDGD